MNNEIPTSTNNKNIHSGHYIFHTKSYIISQNKNVLEN